ncbi:MAG: HAMP domain-containing protein, partial [Dehalococcoidia bacterium]
MAKQSRIRMPSPRGWFRLPLPSSVRGQIIGGFGLLVLILAIVVAGSAWLERAHRSDLAEMERHTVTASLLQQAEVDVTLVRILLQHYIIDEDDAAAPIIRSSVATAVDGLEEALAQEKMRGNEDEITDVEQTIAGAAFLSEVTERVISLRQSDDLQGATATLEGALPRIALLERSLEKAAKHESEEVVELRIQANRTGELAIWLLVVSGVIGGILGMVTSVFIVRSILRPLSSLESAALAVAEGDLEARAPTAGPGELVRLGASLNRMTESLLDASKRRELEAERKWAEEEASLLLTMTQAIGETEDFYSAIEVTLRKVCEVTNWEFAESWIPRPDGTALEYGASWCKNAETLTKFTQLSQQFTFPPGSGLPGRVWLSNQMEWIKDVSTEPDQSFHRARVAQESGLKAALGVPITATGKVLAVMVFFMFE